MQINGHQARWHFWSSLNCFGQCHLKWNMVEIWNIWIIINIPYICQPSQPVTKPIVDGCWQRMLSRKRAKFLHNVNAWPHLLASDLAVLVWFHMAQYLAKIAQDWNNASVHRLRTRRLCTSSGLKINLYTLQGQHLPSAIFFSGPHSLTFFSDRMGVCFKAQISISNGWLAASNL